MAYYKNHKYFKTVKISLSEDEKNEVFVTLREPTTEEAFSLRTEKEDEAIEAFHKLLGSIIIDHNFYEDESEKQKMDSKDVAETIFQSYTIFIKVLTDYTTAVFQSSK